MPEFTLDMFQTAGIAMLLLLLGQRLTERTAFLRRCCIRAIGCCGWVSACCGWLSNCPTR